MEPKFSLGNVKVVLPASGPHDYLARRRAEVAYILKNSAGNIFVVRKKIYPQGILRLPTGGVDPGEDLREALDREVLEETGLEVKTATYLLRIDYKLHWPDTVGDFTTHCFEITVDDANPVIVDKDQEHDHHEWIPPSRFGELAIKLGSIEGVWKGWAQYRTFLHREIAKILNP